jgi:glycosyltransferase involved in cell wall biosynthesis
MSENRSGAPDGLAVLQIVPSLETGGTERSTIEIAAALVREGFTALVASAGGRMVAELEEAGGEWIAMPVNSRSPTTLWTNARRIRDLIRVRNIKLVHARSRAPAWSALWAARKNMVPFVATYHGLYTARTPLKRLYNSVMVRGDAVIANSEWTAQHISSEYGSAPKRLVVIPRGVDLARFDPVQIPAERVRQLRADWGATESDIVVLLPGRLTRLKGQTVLIAALRKLASESQLNNIHAVLVGDAQGRSAYEQELHRAISAGTLERNVIVPGHVNDMPTAYLAADIVVSASTQAESFGRVTAEASAMERPVIATDHGGARETVLPGVSGLLTPPGDSAALARALRELISAGPAGRAAMGAEGRAHIARHFTVERMTRDTIALYRELLGETAADGRS